MKKLKSTLFSVLMISILFLSACGQTQNQQPINTPGTQDLQTQQTQNNTSSDSLKIAIVTTPSGVDDGNFNQNNYEGVLEFIKLYPNSTVKDIKETTGEPAQAVKAVADIVADYDVIVAPGFPFAGISEIAVENPTKKFILVDTEPAEFENKNEFENVMSILFAEQESGFYAGVAAALETKTNKVAMVGGIAFPPVVNFQYGFDAGVNYVNKKYQKNVELIELKSYSGKDVTATEVGGNYIGAFNDEAGGKTVANALINEGVDIIFSVAGASGNGVFTAAKETQDIMVIGVDVDQFKIGFSQDRNVVLTSALKVMDKNVKEALISVVENKFVGGNFIKKADTDSTGIVKTPGNHQMSEETLKIIEETEALLKNGTIVPPSNFSEETSENFKGLPS